MSDKTLAALTAATPATGGLLYGTQGGADRKFTLAAAGATMMEAAATGIKTTICASSQTLTAEQCNNGVVYVTDTIAIGLPPIAEGLSVTVIAIGTIQVQIITDVSDQLFLEGSPLGEGQFILSTSQNGDKAVLTYYSSDGWYAATNGWSLGA